MSNDNWTGEGYDADSPSGGGGLFFRLKTKGQKARLRLVSPCYRYFDDMPGKYTKSGEDEKTPRAAWLAILKDNVNGKITKRAIIFAGGPMIYGLVRKLNDTEEWGDPTLYDITVERTEEAGAYYAVQPMPKPMGPISDDEKALFAPQGEHPELTYNRMVEIINTPREGAKKPAAEDDSYDPYQDE